MTDAELLKQGREQLALLADAFGHHRTPTLRLWDGRSSRFSWVGGILLSRRAGELWADTLCHEFAHAERFAEAAGGPTWGGHDRAFFNTLRRVAVAWFGDARGYAWHHDYKTIWRMAVAAGLTTQPYRGVDPTPPWRRGTAVEWQGRDGCLRTGAVVSHRGEPYRVRVTESTPHKGRIWMVPSRMLRRAEEAPAAIRRAA